MERGRKEVEKRLEEEGRENKDEEEEEKEEKKRSRKRRRKKGRRRERKNITEGFKLRHSSLASPRNRYPVMKVTVALNASLGKDVGDDRH